MPVKVVSVRLAEDELEAIKAGAKALEMDVSSLLLHAATEAAHQLERPDAPLRGDHRDRHEDDGQEDGHGQDYDSRVGVVPALGGPTPPLAQETADRGLRGRPANG